MKAKIKVTKDVEIERIIIDINIRHVGNNDDGDVKPDFPLLDGNVWKAVVMVDTGQILEWPLQESEMKLFCKVCDAGTYTLIDDNGNTVVSIDGYVPNGIVPGSYGDYVELEINESGLITNWPKCIDLEDFFADDD